MHGLFFWTMLNEVVNLVSVYACNIESISDL